MPPSSRRLAQSWPYPRHTEFEKLLQASNRAWFKARRYAVHPRMPYLLARWTDWPKNIIVPAVADAILAERLDRQEKHVGFPLHKYVHHGLSSQALLFNLVGPLLVCGDMAPLQHAFTLAGIPWPAGALRSRFELEDRTLFNEDSGQPTSLDLALQGPDGSRGGMSLQGCRGWRGWDRFGRSMDPGGMWRANSYYSLHRTAKRAAG